MVEIMETERGLIATCENFFIFIFTPLDMFKLFSFELI